MATVAEHMARELVTRAPDEHALAAARAMDGRHVGAAIVLGDGGLRGILTERDVLGRSPPVPPSTARSRSG